MLGIIGIIRRGFDHAGQVAIQDMLSSMAREPSQKTGTVFDGTLGLQAGWVSDQHSISDGLPIWNETHDVCLIFSGECIARKRTTAKCLIQLYQECGIDVVERLNGWFSGLLIDRRLNRVFLFNDRYGLNRIYYHQTNDACYFASEAKVILRLLPELRQLDWAALAEQFSCGCTLQNKTLFSGIALLPAGSVWSFSTEGIVKKETYFQPKQWEDQKTLDADSYYSALRDLFPSLLARYLDGSQKVGMSLTGGLDGRMIMAWAKSAPGLLPCYSFGGTYRDCADVRIARKIATLCGQSHQVIPVNTRFLLDFRSLAEQAVRISDGTMDVTGSVEIFANRFAREIAPIRLTGNYGSEILRGNVAFRPGSNDLDLLTPEFSNLLTNAAQTYAVEAKVNRTTFIAFKQVPWHHYSRLSVEQSQLTLRSPFLDNDLVQLVYRAPRESIDSAIPALRLIADGSTALAQLPTDRGLLLHPKPWTPLKNFWQEFTVRAEYAYDYGMPQWLAKADRAVSRLHLERLFLGRHKFYHFRIWYRNQLAPVVKEILLDPKALARPYLKPKQVERMVNEHTTGRANHTRSIHKLLTAELTQRQLLEQ